MTTTDQLKHLGSQASQVLEQSPQGKGGKKQGRKSLSESIQMVGEMLVNSGSLVSLSMIFHQLNKPLR